METPIKRGFKNPQSRIYFKIAFVLILILLLMIPNGLLTNLIHERSSLQSSTIREVSSTWGAQQCISGPVLILPYLVKLPSTKDQEASIIKKHLFILPEDVNLQVDQKHQIRKRSIYEAILFTNKMEVKGRFNLDRESKAIQEAYDVLWDEAIVNVGISDARGIVATTDLQWNNAKYSFKPGVLETNKMGEGIHSLLSIDDAEETFAFSWTMELRGSSNFSFDPLAKQMTIDMKSTWPSPGFYGGALPVKHEIHQEGFIANWQTSQYSRNFPDYWIGDTYNLKNRKNEIGVRLVNTVDHYQKNMRTIKYALLIISLTFLIFFFFEMLSGKKMHPIQYTLVGFALSIFYLLLIALSEHIGFNKAYFASAIATITIILIYIKSVLREMKSVIVLGAILVGLYSYIYIILQLEDFALLAGAIGLFFILSVIMLLSRKVNWYELSNRTKP